MNPKDTSKLIEISQSLGLSSVEGEYTPNYRRCKRTIFKCPGLSRELWQNLKSYFTTESIARIKPYGVDTTCIPCSGTWIPYSVNEVMRVICYDPGDHFQPHTDGGHVENDD